MRGVTSEQHREGLVAMVQRDRLEAGLTRQVSRLGDPNPRACCTPLLFFLLLFFPPWRGTDWGAGRWVLQVHVLTPLSLMIKEFPSNMLPSSSRIALDASVS
jgi:hypothetical protein